MFLVVIWRGDYHTTPTKTVTHETPYRQVARQYLKYAQSKGLCGRIIRDYNGTTPQEAT
jgi:hypothetical protein